VYQFGPFVIDSFTVRLLKNGVQVEVEPQVYNTLLLLIQNRKRVVTKDELLEKIWQGRVVTDHVITRIIYELRKLLDDKNGEHSHIRTVRGKGYQFIAEISESPVPKQFNNKQSHTVKKARYYLFGLIGLLLITATSFLFINEFSKQSNSAADSPQLPNAKIYPVVAVLPIKVEADNDELSMLVQSFIDYLTNQLAVNLNMKVIHPDSLVSLGDQLDDVWAIQEATRSDYIIQGFIEPVSDQKIKLHLNLFKSNISGELVPFSLGAFEFPYPNNSKELNALYKQRKVTIRSIIEIIKPGMVVNDDGYTETDDPEAYRLVIAAHHISRNDDCKDLQRAEDLLLKAVQRDDEFAYAYYQLFANYFKRVWVCGDSIEYHQKALEMAETVQRLAPNSYNPITLGMNHILIVSNQVEKAYELLKDAGWDNPDIINHKNYGLRYAGFLNLASQQLQRILQIDPYYFSEKPIHQSPNTLLYQNRFSEFLSLLAEPGNSYHDYYRGLSLVLSDKSDEATHILRGVTERKSADLFGKLSQALLLIIEVDYPAAIEVIDEVVKQRMDKKHTDGEMTYKLAQLYAMAGAQELALNKLQTAVNQGFFPMNYFLRDPALKSVQTSEQFTAIVRQAHQRHQAFAERFGLQAETLFGLSEK
jgi:DNA-binding winged helix-turn-helix (wHTH) protein/tetratricopeptide (TPR) repeat protein/TolB-like protein